MLSGKDPIDINVEIAAAAAVKDGARNKLEKMTENMIR